MLITRASYECTWDITGLVTTKTLPINGFFVKQQATVSGHVHQSKLPFSLTLHLDKLISVLQLLSDIRYITL